MKQWFFLGLLVFGVLLSLHALNFDKGKNPIEYLVSLWFGMFFTLVSLAVIYYRVQPNPRGLSILDWSLAISAILFMPVFEALGLTPFWWTLFILFPIIIIGVVSHFCVKYFKPSPTE